MATAANVIDQVNQAIDDCHHHIPFFHADPKKDGTISARILVDTFEEAGDAKNWDDAKRIGKLRASLMREAQNQ